MNRDAVKSGTCILTEQPFVYNLSSKYQTSRCDYCLLNRTKLFLCSGCCYVYYCGPSCQTTAWADHKHECGKIKSLKTRSIPDGLRMMAKLVTKLQNGGYNQKSFYSKTDFRKFRDLMTHEKEIREDPSRMEYFETCLLPFLNNFFSDSASIPTAKELLQIYGKMAVNSFNVLDEDMNSIGTAMYLAASILDHSCQPNAVATFDGRTLNIHSIANLQSVNWDKVFISYIDLMDDTETRRASLKKNYYFLCACSKCVNHEAEEVDMYAALCPDCKEPYLVEKETCSTGFCRFAPSKKFLEEFRDVTNFSKLKLSEMSNTAYLDMAKICLSKQQNILHTQNLLRTKALDVAFDSAITLEKFEEAAEFGKMLLPGFVRYQGESNPLVGILLLKLGKLFMYLNKLDDAEEYLRGAEKILKTTHGERSPVYRDRLVPLLQSVTLKDN